MSAPPIKDKISDKEKVKKRKQLKKKEESIANLLGVSLTKPPGPLLTKEDRPAGNPNEAALTDSNYCEGGRGWGAGPRRDEGKMTPSPRGVTGGNLRPSPETPERPPTPGLIKGRRRLVHEDSWSSDPASQEGSDENETHPISIRPWREDPSNLNMSFTPDVIFSPSHSSPNDLDSTVQSMDAEDMDHNEEEVHWPKSIFSKC